MTIICCLFSMADYILCGLIEVEIPSILAIPGKGLGTFWHDSVPLCPAFRFLLEARLIYIDAGKDAPTIQLKG